MHGQSERRDAGSEGHDGTHRPPARPIAAIEAYAIGFLILAAIGVSNLVVYFKLDYFQHATMSLVEGLDQSRIRQRALDIQIQQAEMTELLSQVRANQAKVDAVAAQTLEISQQTSAVTHQNALMLEQLKTITESHTREIKAAKNAARAAQAQTRATEKAVAQPWYKRVFK